MQVWIVLEHLRYDTSIYSVHKSAKAAEEALIAAELNEDLNNNGYNYTLCEHTVEE